MKSTPEHPTLAAGELELERVRCDLCGADETRERYKKPDTGRWTSDFEFPVVECTHCGLVFVNPRPTRPAMSAFYVDGYHDGRDTAGHQRRYARQAAFLPALESQRVLDIGCARGDFLAHLLARHPRLLAHGVDAYSSGVTFSGWAGRPLFRLPDGSEPLPVSPARTELLASSWKRFGLIDPFERPGPHR